MRVEWEEWEESRCTLHRCSQLGAAAAGAGAVRRSPLQPLALLVSRSRELLTETAAVLLLWREGGSSFASAPSPSLLQQRRQEHGAGSGAASEEKERESERR